MPTVLTTASCPATAASHCMGCAHSPSTTRTPDRACNRDRVSCNPLAPRFPRRTRQVTVCPCVHKAWSTCPPIKPVAPVRKIFMVRPSCELVDVAAIPLISNGLNLGAKFQCHVLSGEKGPIRLLNTPCLAVPVSLFPCDMHDIGSV